MSPGSDDAQGTTSTNGSASGTGAGGGGPGGSSSPAGTVATPRGVTTAPLDGDHTNTVTGPEDFPFSY